MPTVRPRRNSSRPLTGIVALLVLLSAVLSQNPVNNALAAGNTALQLNGTNQHATLGNATQLRTPTFTLELWFQRTGAGVGTGTGNLGIASAIPLIAKGRAEAETAAADINYFFGIDAASGKLVADFEEAQPAQGGTTGGLNHPFAGTAVIPVGPTWHHAAATYDGNVWKLYLDGALDGTSPTIARPANALTNVLTTVGTALTTATAPPVPAGRFAGVVDEVRIWNTARTAAQINATWNVEVTAPQANLIGSWNLNEGTGTTLADSSGSGIAGAAVGTPPWVPGFPAFVSNTPPTATADSYTTERDVALNVAAPGVIANDTDAQTDPLTAVLDAGPTHGGLTLNPNGSFTYTPAAGYTGPDNFTYHANDGAADSNIATVSITVTTGPPAAPTVTLNAPSDGATATITPPSLAVDVADSNGDALSVEFWGRAAASGVFALIATNTAVPAGSTTSTTWADRNDGQRYEWFVKVADGTSIVTSPTWTFNTAAGAGTVFVGAGDIADCTRTQDEATAAVITGIQGTIWTAGDNVYPNGTVAEFANCYDASWGGSIKARTRPTAGNHDWNTGNLNGYNGYFGVAATDANGLSYYSYDLDADWHVVNLDTECVRFPDGCTAGGAQERWLRADLAAHASMNVIAVWHKPRFSSSITNLAALQPFMDDFYAYGVDLVLQGHDHVYERIGLTDASGAADPTYGIRTFTVGTGGAALFSSFGTVVPTSEVRNTNTYGVLKLTLHADSYDWDFFGIAGQTFTDSGSAPVHDAPPGPPAGNLGLQLNTGAYVTFGDPAKLDLGQFTIETWFKRTGTGIPASTGTTGITSFVPLVTHGSPQADGSNVDANWVLGINTSGNVIAADFEDMASGGNHPISGTTEITQNVWHHAAATFDGTNWRVYLDGNLEASNLPGAAPRSDTIQQAALGAMITSTGVANGRFAGVLDEARVWNLGRSEAELDAAQALELTSGTGLVARWGLNDGIGGSVSDSITTPTAANGAAAGGSVTWVAGAPIAPPAPNSAPDTPTVNAPANGATAVSTPPTLDVAVTDPDADPVDVTFFGRPLASGVFTEIGTDNAVASGSNATVSWSNLGAGQTFEWYVTVDDGSLVTTSATWTFHTVPSVAPVFVGTGDIASCAVTTDNDTGNLIAGVDGVIWTTGDNVYPNGTAADFTNCYAPTPWGTPGIKNRTRPTPGNHDWGVGAQENLDGYFGYYGANATDANGQSYYSYDIAGSNWHVVNLDSECPLVAGGCGIGSPQETWLQADLAANASKNVIAVWHRPRYSSGSTNYQALQPLWDALYVAGVDILLDGHDHIYERTAPMRSGANLADPPVADPTYGIRQFTVGTGGEAHHGLATPLPTSQVRDDDNFGILKLTLHATTYDWVFLPVAGSTFTDSGTGTVHGAPAPSTFTDIPVSTGSGEKPQSKLWEHGGTWWAVLPSSGVTPAGTWLWRLNPDDTWSNVLLLSSSLTAKADARTAGNLTHVLLHSTAPQLVSLEYVAATNTYRLWTSRPAPTNASLPNSETATIDIDSTGRMWLATENGANLNVYYSDSPYTSFSGPIALATNINEDDISVVTALPNNTVGVLWSNQTTQRFGFKVHVDGAAPGTWSADEVPASASALPVGAGMADDHLSVVVAADGTLYAAVKTSYDTVGYPRIALLVRRPGAGTGGTWDPLYEVDQVGTRGIVLLNEDDDTVRVVYTSTEGYNDLVVKQSRTSAISFGPRSTLITDAVNDATSTHEVWSGRVPVIAASPTLAHTAFLQPSVNGEPTFDQDVPNQSHAEGAIISLDAGATDPDADVLTYAAANLPTGLSISTTTGLISGTIANTAAAGSPYSVSVTVRDGATTDDTDTFSWTVTDGAPGGAITLRGAASGFNTATTSLLLPVPTGTVAGDVLVAAVTVRNNPTITPPTGWSVVRTDTRGTSVRQAVFVHVATAGEPASYSWTFSLARTAVGTVAAYSGVDTANPIDAHSGQANLASTSITAASLTTTVGNTQLVGFFALTGKSTIAPPAGMAERSEIVTPAPTASKLTAELADEPRATGGATGARIATGGSSSNNIGQLVALRPAP